MKEILLSMIDAAKQVQADGLIGVGLVISLIIAIFVGSTEIAKDIALGLVGFMGRGKLTKDKQ